MKRLSINNQSPIWQLTNKIYFMSSLKSKNEFGIPSDSVHSTPCENPSQSNNNNNNEDYYACDWVEIAFYFTFSIMDNETNEDEVQNKDYCTGYSMDPHMQPPVGFHIPVSYNLD